MKIRTILKVGTYFRNRSNVCVG